MTLATIAFPLPEWRPHGARHPARWHNPRLSVTSNRGQGMGGPPVTGGPAAIGLLEVIQILVVEGGVDLHDRIEGGRVGSSSFGERPLDSALAGE